MHDLKLSCTRALFLVTGKFYCIVLLHPFWNRPNTGLGRFKYFIDAVLSWFLNKKQNRKRFYIKIRNRAAHDLKLSCTRALFLITGKFYSVAQALTKAPRQPASLKCNFLIGWKNDVIWSKKWCNLGINCTNLSQSDYRGYQWFQNGFNKESNRARNLKSASRFALVRFWN